MTKDTQTPRRPYLFPAAQPEVPASRRRRSYSGEVREAAALGPAATGPPVPLPGAGPPPGPLLPRGGVTSGHLARRPRPGRRGPAPRGGWKGGASKGTAAVT